MTNDELQSLLLEAEDVGYMLREWDEAREDWIGTKRHPFYEKIMKSDEGRYRESRAKLYERAGIPEPKKLEFGEQIDG